MRIIALPLARVKISRGSRKTFNNVPNTMLVFYHFDLISPRGGAGENISWHQKVLKSAINKAAELWISLGKAPKGSWKLWTYELSERVANRIEFEESALSSVEPSLGPTIPLTEASKQVDGGLSLKIPLIYPPSLYPVLDHALHPALAHLQTLLASRGPRHRRGFYLWMLIAPLTIPLVIIPIIPNLPLFFCVWRSWSHYRAYRSSQYLSSLLDRRLIEPNPSLELDKIYASLTPPSTTFQNSPLPSLPSISSENKSTVGDTPSDRNSGAACGTGESLPEGILLTHKAVPLILGLFRLPESAALNIRCALEQAHRRLGGSP